MLAACSPGALKTRYGVLVNTADGSFVRIGVVTDDIIHVEAVPSGGRLPTKKSLMIVPQKPGAKYTVTKTDSTVVTFKLIIIFIITVNHVKTKVLPC